MICMKTLLLIRHAKAEWGDLGQQDFARSLSERGIKQAHDITQQLKAKNLMPDMILSSSAKRTQMTTQVLTAAMAGSVPQVEWCDALYLAEPSVLLHAAQQVENGVHTLALVAHNPGLSELSNDLLGGFVDEMSPASVVAISWAVQHWSDISENTGTLCAYLRPNRHD